jgi:hypothetical protein
LPIAQDLSTRYPEDTLIQSLYQPLAKAFLAFAAGHAQEAIDAAEPARAWDAAYPGSYVQGLAYLQMHDAGRAVAAFQTATQAAGGSLTAGLPFQALAQLGQARAYAMAGDKANAKKAYEAFFQTWKNADSTLSQLVAAKKEYAAL